MATSVYQQGGYGTAGLFPNPIVSPRSPTTTDKVNPTGQPYQIFQGWENSTTGTCYIYLGGGNWVTISSITGDLTQLTGDTGTATPLAGSIQIAGTANQVSSTASGNAITLSLIGPYTPATYTAHGVLLGEGTASIVATTAGAVGTLFAGAGNAADPSFTASPTITGTMTAATGFVATTAGSGITLNSPTATGTTTATINGRSGQLTLTTPSIAAGATYQCVITNSAISASTTQVLYGLTGGTTGAAITIQSVTNAAGSSTVVLMNGTGATANTGSLVLTFLVLN